ncbi:MAG: MATE family efflux transporter [Acidobacteria bacterium]|nr:MATE family efflux transporter [Acidobacteriota bacterium]
MLSDRPDRAMYQRIWSLAWPTVVYSVLELSLGIADLVMVRGLGQEATAAIGLTRQIAFLLEAAALAIATGVITLVSQGVGSGNRQQVDGVIHQSTRLVFLLGVPVTLVGCLASRPLLVAMQATPETLSHGVPYLHVYFLGTLFLWGNVISAAIFRGTGDATTPLKVATAVSLLNVILNYAFIFGLGPLLPYGVTGAAIGTVAARAIGCAIYLVLLTRGTRHVHLRLHPWWGLDWTLTRRILRVGLPLALAGIVRNGARLVFLGMLGASALGASMHAAAGVGLQVRLVSVLPALAFQIATATLVGQAIGGGHYDRAEALGRRSVQLLAMIMVGVVVLTFLLARPLAALFIADAAVVTLGATVLRWFAVAQFFSSISICTQGALTGAGDTKPILRYTIVTQWGLLLSLTYVLLVGFEWEPEGPLLAWVLAPLVQLVLMQRLLRSGRWKRLRV